MEKKFNIKKTSKNSLEDLLDIRKKNLKFKYWEELETEDESEAETKPKKTIRICFEEYQKMEANQPKQHLCINDSPVPMHKRWPQEKQTYC